MSAGDFEVGKYETNGSTYVYECRVQEETKELALNGVTNDYPAAAATAGLPTLEISKRGRRGFGITPRTVIIELTAAGTGETAEYAEGNRYEIPVFSESVWNGFDKGQTGTYLGIACVYRGKSPEVIK
jgi:hypothetical protein